MRSLEKNLSLTMSTMNHRPQIDAPLSPLAIVMSEIDADYYELHRMHGWYGLFLVDANGNLHDIGIWFRGEYAHVIAQVRKWAEQSILEGYVIINKPYRPSKRARERSFRR